MKKKYLLLVLIFLFSLVGCSGNVAKDTAGKVSAKETPNNNPSRVVAMIDKVPVKEADLEYNIFRHHLISKLHGDTTTGPNMYTRASAITEIIQMKAIDELAKLKGINVTEAERQSRVGKIKREMEKSPIFKEEVGKYGEELFWKNEYNQYEYIIQSEKLLADIIEKKKVENPKGTEKEWKFDAMKDLDEIIYQQVDDMKIEMKEKM